MIKLSLNFNETDKLVRFANKMCGFYGHPVYLVGSQLTSETPKDVDVVCILPDEEFKLRWFPDWFLGENSLQDEIDKFYLGVHTGIHLPEHWNWYEEMVKKSLFGRKSCRLPIDFKTESKSYAETHFNDKEMLRLDTRGY